MSDPHDLKELERDPRLFLYTSLTAGSSHIITATSRLETILKANRVPFQAIDVATDEKARRLWQRRAGKRKLPGLVKDGFVLGVSKDLDEVEEWNEYGELKENIGDVPAAGASVPPPKTSVNTTAAATSAKTTMGYASDMPKRIALPGAAEIAARNKPKATSTLDEEVKAETILSAPAEKEKSIEKTIRFKGDDVTSPKKEEIADSTEKKLVSEPAAKSDIQADPTETKSPSEPAAKSDNQADLTEEKSPSEPAVAKKTSDAAAGASKEAEIEKAATEAVEDDGAVASKPTGDLTSKKHETESPTPIVETVKSAIAAVVQPLVTTISTDKTADAADAAQKAEPTKHEAVEAAVSEPTPESEKDSMPAEKKEEKALPILPKPESETETDKVEPTPPPAEKVLPVLPLPENGDDDEAAIAKSAASKAETTSESKDVTKTQEQPAAEPELATVSVQD